MAASKGGRTATVQLLLEAGFDKEVKDEVREMRCVQRVLNASIIHVYLPCVRICFKNRLGEAERVKRGVRIVHVRVFKKF